MPGSPSLVGRAPGNNYHKARSRKGTGVQISLPAPNIVMYRPNEQNLPTLNSSHIHRTMKDKRAIDWHNSQKRVELAKIRITKRFSKENIDTACRFLDKLRLGNMSYGRIENYSGSTIRILQIKDDKKIEDWSKREIEQVHKVIADSAYENSVKKDTLTALKRLYHFAVHDEIVIKAKGIEYDPVVSWITPGSFVDRFEKIQSKDLLTDNEILQLIQTIKQIGGRFVKRNIALVFILLEGAYRPGELLNIRIGGIEFESDFVRIHTTGKTGPKSLTLVASYGPLKEWISLHPQSDDPDAFLFYQDNDDGVMRYWTLDYIIRHARKKANIKKRIWPYLFRHTSLTEYSKRLGNVAKIYGNWSKDSHMLTHYEHLANSDQEDAVLKLHNLKKENNENSILFPKICPSCKQRNSSDNSHCLHCGMELAKTLVHLRETRKKSQSYTIKELENVFFKRIESLELLFEKQQQLIATLINERNTIS